MKNTAISVLGVKKDALGGRGPSRWNVWRPNIGLVRQENLAIDELHLVLNRRDRPLAERVAADIRAVSPETSVVFDVIELDNPWDFEEVYAKFYDYAQSPCFHEESTNYFIHITTGSHVEQICLFLLAESRHLPGVLVQTSPREGHARRSPSPAGTCSIIDLDLSRYDRIASRFETRRQEGLAFLKQGIDTRNPAFNRLIETIERVAVNSSDPLLLTGPSGAGKTRLARQIHRLKLDHKLLSGRFVAVNCATLGGDLAKSALFGHRKGAFSGSAGDHAGFLKEADAGLLFLDEVGELPMDAQAMLLKAIEEKSFRPLGASEDVRSDFQLVCGSNRDLSDPARFRPDLLARINLWHFRIPGLADRREDIAPNLAYELDKASRKTGRHISFSREALDAFMAFALDPANLWPGNFRDLNAMVTRMATLAHGGRISLDDVRAEIARSSPPPASDPEPDAGLASLAGLLGEGFESRFDRFDLVQLADVVRVCRESLSMADAAKRLFAVSRLAKKSSNDSDRLSKYLARFGLRFRSLRP